MPKLKEVSDVTGYRRQVRLCSRDLFNLRENLVVLMRQLGRRFGKGISKDYLKASIDEVVKENELVAEKAKKRVKRFDKVTGTFTSKSQTKAVQKGEEYIHIIQHDMGGISKAIDAFVEAWAEELEDWALVDLLKKKREGEEDNDDHEDYPGDFPYHG